MNGNRITNTFSSLRSRLKNVASAILRNEDDAEDALQDAFCRLWNRRETIESEKIEANARLAIRQVSLDILRRRKLRATDEINEDTVGESPEQSSLWNTSEINDLRIKLLDTLSPRQREVFEMVSEGLENSVIAERLGISEEGVRQNLSRARKALRHQYNQLK